ncbi:MAG TPA: phytanoyl-CoA dioxygenase family protein [Phototrophicaceae bacterium]|nr:phytanoyl-CoA dioxygenase family protein [Phototrophicaceae bacterium]
MELTTLPLSKPGEMTEMDQFIFECFGFIVIEDVLSEAECDEVLEAAKRVHAGQPKEKLLQIGKGFEHEPAIERLIDHPAVLPKVRGIYGDNFVLQAAWCTVQPAGSQSVGWHQDGSSAYDFKKLAYPVPLIQLRASYHLTDQTKPFMGNMMLVPGSHRSKLDLPPSARKEVYACAVQQILLAKRGSVLLFHNGVWHSPMPNNMTWDRYNMHFIYSPPWVRRSDRDETDHDFLEHTTPLRRALMGDYARPDVPFAGGFPSIPFETNGHQ